MNKETEVQQLTGSKVKGDRNLNLAGGMMAHIFNTITWKAEGGRLYELA